MIFLWYAGHEASCFRDVADRFNITISSLHYVINNVAKFISNLSKHFITWPTDNEQSVILEDFKNMGFQGVIGCIDGSHIIIDKPSEDPSS